ncbi:ABC transporter ATP-binding protein [Castellaniella sp. GW247-6E4]|uniref:ABC transporter ATP-binding protein n=1 Tax=Castellaniella sp. GW247-6E4 TaxID=3140380 RepID=UPI00331619DD
MAISIKSVSAGYGKFEVLRDLSSEIPQGDCRLIIGPNGAGKTTLLRCLFGMLKIRTGDIIIDEQRVDGLGARKLLDLGVAYVPQESTVFPIMSVEDNLLMGAFQRPGMARDEVDKAFDRFPILKKRRTSQAKTLSGGERRMLEVGRALMGDPKILMLDEPSLGLSPTMMSLVLEQVSTINSMGVTVIIVEQKVKVGLKIAKNVSVLRLGSFVKEGTAAEAQNSDWLEAALYGN